MKIKKGTPCFLSNFGHNNFLYPVYSRTGLTYFERDIEKFEVKSWICGKPDLKAILVDAIEIKDLYGDGKTVVWVLNKHLKDT